MCNPPNICVDDVVGYFNNGEFEGGDYDIR
jgi:hypothetical protein